MTKMHKLFQIFKAGTHKAMSGVTLDFSERDLQMTAAAFSPASRPAPLVLGHPKDDQPAYGQVRGLFVKDGDLFAQAVVDSALETLVKTGRYRHISASFISPFASDNPTPGAYYLKHVGFLGGAPARRPGHDASGICRAGGLPQLLRRVRLLPKLWRFRGIRGRGWFAAGALGIARAGPGLSTRLSGSLLHGSHQPR